MSRQGDHFVDADIRWLLDEADTDAADFWEMQPAEARQAMDAMVDGMLPPVAVAEVTDLVVPGADADVPARLYRPDAPTAGELLVFFHGGGWEVGSVETFDRSVRRLANDSGMSVLSVDYRLAPEHPFPAALDDCTAALAWASEHAEEIGVDSTFVAVGGDSAGGNLAAAVAQRARGVDHGCHRSTRLPVRPRCRPCLASRRVESAQRLRTPPRRWRTECSPKPNSASTRPTASASCPGC